MIVLEAAGVASDDAFSVIVEIDETHQRESLKVSREGALHLRNPLQYPRPPRHQWYVYKSGRVKMPRGLSRWQFPLLTITDRSGQQYLERTRNRSIPVIDAALSPVVATDAVPCTDGAAAYARFTKKNTLDHHVLSNKPGKRIAQKAFHIRNVNALHSRYNDFMGPFKGPASKYLGSYLRWFLLRSKMDGGAVFRGVISTQ